MIELKSYFETFNYTNVDQYDLWNSLKEVTRHILLVNVLFKTAHLNFVYINRRTSRNIRAIWRRPS